MDKYFKPEISDIRVGYEFEYRFSYDDEWKKAIIKPTTDIQYLVDIYNNIIGKEGGLRTLYLTKEQIEAEGCIYKGRTQDIWFEKGLDYDMGSWTAYKIIFQYGLEDKRLRIFAVDIVDKLEYDLFIGYCKSINEFRYICKLLKI